MYANLIRKLVASFVVLAGLMGASIANAAIIIDNFLTSTEVDDPSEPDSVGLIVNGNFSLSKTVGGTTILGGAPGLGFRTVTVTGISGNEPGNFATGFVNPPSYVSFTTGTNALAEFSLLYNANGDGLGGFDLTETGLNNVIVVHVRSASPVPPPLTNQADLIVTITDTASAVSSHTIKIPGSVSLDFKVNFDFSNFTGVDLENVDAIEVKIVGAIDGDYSLNSIFATTTVPEPSSLPILAGLMGLGLIGMVGQRWRRGRLAKA